MARYALVIGIAEYLSPSLSRLSKTTNDAEAIAQLLEQYGDFQSVQRLPQRWNKEKNGYEMAASKVTGAQLGQDLRTFLLEQATNNEALIYFSGHGFTISDNLGQQKGYLASSDCQIEFKDNENVEQKYGIPLNSLNDLIRDSQLSSLVMLLDCCHSGYFLERQLIERTLNAFSSQKDYYLITACRGFERAGVIKSEEYSIFTGAVVKGLTAENAGNSRRISGDRLFDFVSNELKGSVQEPIRMGWGRSITLVTYPQLDATTAEKVAFNQENPYRGLYAFESEQAQYFCGRDEAVRTLISRLAESRFLAVIGYSGSGKSSLVKAGLLPQLKGDRLPGSSEWAIASFTPGEHPLGKLVDILARQQQQNQPHLLFIDQFEEIFTLCQDDEERKTFIRLIAQEVKKAEVETRIILTIRGDFLNRCADYREIITLINNIPPTSFIITPMSFAELEEAIEKPAKLHGVTFERGLVSQISADVVNRPGVLPILQYALKELWRVCIEEPESPEPLLTRKGYEEIGGVKGALDKRATILYESLTTVDQAFARRLFMELVQLGEAGEVTRRRASWERLEVVADSPQQLQRVIGLLAGSQQRLIITDEKTVEVAHEALLSEWKLLNTWIAENLENIRLSRSLEEDCQEWVQRFNKSDDALLTGANLAVISEWVNKTQARLAPLESEFLHKSLERRDREIKAQLEQERQLRELAEARQKEAEARVKAEAEKVRQERGKTKAEKQRTRLAIGTGLIVTLLLISLGILRLQAAKEEIKITKEGEINTLITASETFFNTDYQIEALLEGAKALKNLNKIELSPESKIKFLIKLRFILSHSNEHNRILQAHKFSVVGVSFNPQFKDKIFASSGKDNFIKIWKTDGNLLKILRKNTAPSWSVVFSPDGEYIASANSDKTVKIWDKKGNYITELRGHESDVNSVSFSPDHHKIVSGGDDKTVRIWQINWQSKSYKQINMINMKRHTDKVNSVNFSPNGQYIVSTSDDKKIIIWDQDGNYITTLSGHQDKVLSASFGSDSHSLVSVGFDRKLIFWKWQTNPQTKKIYEATIKSKLIADNIGRSFKVNFSPNYQFIAAINNSETTTIDLWQADGTKLASLRGHKIEINDFSFSPDSKTIVTASRDQTIRLWDINLNKNEKYELNVVNLETKYCAWLKDYLNSNPPKNQDNPCNNL
ncbi:nSTAND1 domain-containing NTPase [Nostoc sp.]|uniref:nSTAND1 domain-containing NTPase n=1 Tax=Nostoc sp. TaxID=1180 RepID=UPI002FF74268